MQLSRLGIAATGLAAIVALGAWALPAHADTHPAHWTDGTTCQGGFCPGGPPPLPARWDGAACGSDLLIDPPTYVFVTVHAFENGTEYASEVVPYVRVAPGLVHGPSALLDGHKGYVDLTWNIGLGRSERMSFDCAPSQCELPEGCSTTTTTAPPSTTTSTVPTTSTTVVEIGTPISAAAPAPAVPMQPQFTG